MLISLLAFQDMVLAWWHEDGLTTHFETVARTKFLSVFLLFYLLHTIKTLVYLMHIRRVVFNCLVVCLTRGPSSNLVEVVVDRDAVKWNFDRRVQGLETVLFLLFFLIHWRKIWEADWNLLKGGNFCFWGRCVNLSTPVWYLNFIGKLNGRAEASPGSVFISRKPMDLHAWNHRFSLCYGGTSWLGAFGFMRSCISKCGKRVWRKTVGTKG